MMNTDEHASPKLLEHDTYEDIRTATPVKERTVRLTGRVKKTKAVQEEKPVHPLRRMLKKAFKREDRPWLHPDNPAVWNGDPGLED